jgi:hypothetical protein
MYDVRTKEGLQLRIHVPVIPVGTKVPCEIFFTGIGERGTDINRVDNVGPLYYVNNPDPDVPVNNRIIIGPLNESGGWEYWEVRSVIDYCLSAFTEVLNTLAIHVSVHSLGGQAIWQIVTNQTKDANGKRLCDYVASLTGIAPVPGPINQAALIAATGIPAWFFHSEFDSQTGTPYKATEDMVNAVNKAAGRPMWRITKWPGTSHAIVGKTYNLYEWNDWQEVIQRAPESQPVSSMEIINGEARFRTSNGVYSVPVTKIE